MRHHHQPAYTAILLLICAWPLFAACGTLQVGIERTPTPTATEIVPTATPTLTPTPTPAAGPEDLCKIYLELRILAGDAEEQAVVTSYQCREISIDSTGRSPSASPTLTVLQDTPLDMAWDTPQLPTAVEARLYRGGGLSASFMRWPEELPTGAEIVDRLQPQAGLPASYVPRVEPGVYSLVVRATWKDNLDVFYAVSFVLVGAATPTETPHATAWSTYSNATWKIALQYPAHWQAVSGEEGRHAGEDGFFAIDAIGSSQATIDDIVADMVGHKLRPYGSQPTVENVYIQGQEARLVFPSGDAGQEAPAALVARYPVPVQLGDLVQFFVLYADRDHIRGIAQTVRFVDSAPPVETPTPAPIPQDQPKIAFLSATPTEVEPGSVVTLAWEASGAQATLCPSARFILFAPSDCRSVPLTGETTFTIPLDVGGNRFIDYLLTVESEGAASPAVWQASVALKCHTTWFFSNDLQAGICPREAVSSYAAVQRFERGTMIWIEQIGRYVILEGAVPDGRVSYVSDPLDIVRDTLPEVTAPDGLYVPVSGFGLVWRGDVANVPSYREALGWALEPEFGYETTWQCDDALPSGGRPWQSCYLRGPGGEVIALDPLDRWHLVDASE